MGHEIRERMALVDGEEVLFGKLRLMRLISVVNQAVNVAEVQRIRVSFLE